MINDRCVYDEGECSRSAPFFLFGFVALFCILPHLLRKLCNSKQRQVASSDEGNISMPTVLQSAAQYRENRATQNVAMGAPVVMPVAVAVVAPVPIATAVPIQGQAS